MGKKWWDSKATANFQHLDRSYVMKYKEMWEGQFLKKVKWSDKRVIDYGIGGGYLGEVLFREYGIKSYTGIDISDRSLNQARETLAKYIDSVDLKLSPQRFSDFSPDIFFCQEVIQHFPTLAYLDEFLENVDKSGAAQVILQFRQG